MTTMTRLLLWPAVMAAGACLTPPTSSDAEAQITISVPGFTRSYYNGYSSSYPAPSAQYGYPSSGYPYSGGYGFRTGNSYSTFYSGAYSRSGRYRPVYVPQSTRYYVPYGYGYRGY